MTKTETSPTSPDKKALHGEAQLPSTMPEGHATREFRSSSPPGLVIDYSPVEVPPTDMATVLAIGDELDELEFACNNFNAQVPPSNESWQVVDVDSVADALEAISLCKPTPVASIASETGSTTDGNQVVNSKEKSSDEACEGQLPAELPNVKAEGQEHCAIDLDDSKSIGNKAIASKPVENASADMKSINGTPPYYTPPTGPAVFHTASKFCRCCSEPATYRITKPDNENGNAGRPYWVCTNKMCYCTIKSKYEDGWVSWADHKGVDDENPVCYCGVPSRQDKIGKDEGKKGLGFWTCAERGCEYYSEDADGLEYHGMSREHLAFEPWLL